MCLPSTEGNVPVEYEIDRPKSRPSLADLTRKGIELLDNPKGFFAMIEGAMIDHASHENDGSAMVREVLALDEAVGEAMAFAAKHPSETLIVVAADHETGALAVGGTGGGSLNFMAAKLSGQKGSHEVLDARIKGLRAANASFEQVLPVTAGGVGSERFTGCYGNTEIFAKILSAMPLETKTAAK